jgi:hypothetical protein
MLSSACAVALRPDRDVASPFFATLWLIAAPAVCAAAVLTPELQKQVRAATFEVVIKKPEKDAVTYEKALPLELIPFAERNDAYWSTRCRPPRRKRSIRPRARARQVPTR